MYKNVIDPGKSVSFVLKDIDIGGQIQYLMCTGSFKLKYWAKIEFYNQVNILKFHNQYQFGL